MNESSQYSKTVKDIKGPKGVPILGNLLEMDKSKIHLVYEKWADEFGTFYNLSVLGKRITVSTDPDNNAFILKNRPTKFRRFKKMADIIEEVGVHGVFSAEGEDWKKQRKVTQKALSNKSIRSFFPGILKVADRLSNHWKNNNLLNEHEISNDFINATVDVTTNLAFGYDMNTVENKVDTTQEHIKKIFPKINDRISSPIPFWKYFKTASDRSFDESMKHIKKVFGDFITNAQDNFEKNPSIKDNPSNFLEAMLASQDKDNPFTWDEIFGNLYTMLLAGEDTTSNSLAWITYFLAIYPEEQKKIQQEIADVIGDEKLTDFDQLEKFEYLNAVINEALRLKPVSPNLYIQTIEDVVIDDVLFPKDSFIVVQLSHAQKSEKYFQDTDVFAPERWLETKAEEAKCPYHAKHNATASKPFGGGARLCPGMFLSEVEMKVFIVTLFQQYNVELTVNKEEVTELFAFTMSPQNLKVKMTKRKEIVTEEVEELASNN